jgi:hypothetical protein
MKRFFFLILQFDPGALLAAFLLDLLFRSEDRSNTFLRNVCKLLPDYMASHSKRYYTPFCVSITKPNWLMLFKEIIAVYSENHTKHTNTLCGKIVRFFNVKQVVNIVTTEIYTTELY